MKSPVLFHSWPAQSDPTIFVGRNTFAAGTTAATRHQQWVLNLTLKGHCRWSSAGRDYFVGPGHLLLLRAATTVEWEVPAQAAGGENPAWETLWIMFHPSPRTQEWLSAQRFTGDVAHIILDDLAIFTQLRKRMLIMHRLYSRQMLYRDEWTYLELDRFVLTLHSQTARRQVQWDPRIRRAMQFIHANYGQALTLHDIARDALLSVSYLSSLFTEQIGLSPMKYLEQVRMERAADLLRFSQTPISQVAALNGYPNAEYFSHRFRKYSGQSPRAFRQSALTQALTDSPLLPPNKP
jgi:AraC family transcriptional regulator of arabinose operon